MKKVPLLKVINTIKTGVIMQKVVISLIFILLAAQFLTAQKIDTRNIAGKYRYRGSISIELNLYANGRFIEKFNTGMGNVRFLYGNWRLKGDKLILDYFLPKKTERSKYYQNHCETTNMSDTVFFYVYDQTGKPLIGDDYCGESCLVFLFKDRTKLFLTKVRGNQYKIHKSEIPKKVLVYLVGGEYKDLNVHYEEKKGNCIHLHFGRDNIYRYKRKRKYTIENGVIKVSNHLKMRKQLDE